MSANLTQDRAATSDTMVEKRLSDYQGVSRFTRYLKMSANLTQDRAATSYTMVEKCLRS